MISDNISYTNTQNCLNKHNRKVIHDNVSILVIISRHTMVAYDSVDLQDKIKDFSQNTIVFSHMCLHKDF